MRASPVPSRTRENDPLHVGDLVDHVNGYDVIACERCGFRHVVPLPDPSDLNKTYTDDYYGTVKPTYLAHAAEDEDWFTLGFDDRLDAMEGLLPARRRRLVDIGAGPGLFVARAAARGWQAKGVEPSRQACAFAETRGANMVASFFTQDIATALGTADAVHLMNMLEHVPDPAALLARAGRLLEPGGVVCVGVPNDYSPIQTMLREARHFTPWWVAPPHHLNFFDFQSLETLLRRVGLTPRLRLSSFPMEMFLALGQNYVGDDTLGRACHALRKSFDRDLEAYGHGARRRLYRALADAGFGREAIIIATKDTDQDRPSHTAAAEN